MKFEIVSDDRRGWIGVVKLPDGKEAIMIFTRAGFLRGGEYHKSDQHDLILHGALNWSFFDESGALTEGRIQRKGEGGTIKAGERHLAKALVDTLYVEYLDSDFEKTFVPELRKLVDDQFKS